MKKLVLIDAHAIIHRAYHALPPLTSPSGEPTNAVYGFTTILLRIIRELKPDYIAAAFDLAGPTFRHAAYARYKAHRPETPSDLMGQFEKTREVLRAFGIQIFEKAGFEADDVIGTIAKKVAGKKDIETLVVTGDLDALQLVRSELRVYAMKKGITDTIIYDEAAVRERFGLRPEQLIDFKGLRGDPSDNIPGVKGVGEKTASELLSAFGSIEGIYATIEKGTDKISERVKEKLKTGAEDAKFSRELATINCDVPINFILDDARWQDGRYEEKILEVFQKFGFSSLVKRLQETKKWPRVPHTGAQETLLPTQSVSVGAKILAGWDEAERVAKASEPPALFLYENTPYLCVNEPKTILSISEELLKQSAAKMFFSKRRFFVHDGKPLIRFLKKHGFDLAIEFDTMLAAYVVGPLSRDFSYRAVCERELGYVAGSDPASNFSLIFLIVETLKRKLAVGRLEKVFREIELPMEKVLASLEERGVIVDGKFLKKLAAETNVLRVGLTEEIYKLSGEDFNINSSQQLSRILFEKLAIRTAGLRKTKKGGVPSTRESELEKLKSVHPVIEKVLEYRELTKLKTTYLDVLPRLIEKKTGRLHTTFNQVGTATGRLSSANPNLQNIPVVSEIGKKIRRAFVAEKNFLLASFDYSQIELRVAAHLADDKKMIEAFQRGMDIHRLTASEVYNISPEEVTPELRRAAKTLNFGVLYGMGPQAFSEATGMSREEAKKFIQEYFEDFSGVARYISETKKFAEAHGYVETLFGRRRYLPEILSPNWQIKREAERMAVNMPIQGTATGDIAKMAMIQVDEWIKKECREDMVRMLLQVHDELLFEIEEKIFLSVAPHIKSLMEHVVSLKVPLVVDIKAGRNWGEQEAVIFDFQ